MNLLVHMAFDLASLTSFFKDESKPLRARTSVMGIDIGSSSVKVVQLKDIHNVPTLETYGELQLGPYEGIDVGRGTHLTPQKLIEAVVDILREAGVTAKDAACALSYNSSFTATIKVPTADQEKIPAMLPVEARKYIPVSLTKVKLEWFPISTDIEAKTTDTLISAVYNEAQERYDTVLKGCNVRPLASEIEIFSTVRSTLSPKETTVAVLDCGASSTRMYIIHKGIVVKTHSVLLSGQEVTDALHTALAIEFKDAEELKRNVGMYGKERDPRIQKTMQSTLDRGLRELHTVMKRYEDDEGLVVERIVLSGGGALLKGIETYVQDMFSRPIVRAHPFSKVAFPAFLEDILREAGPSFAVAVGVALRTFEQE